MTKAIQSKNTSVTVRASEYSEPRFILAFGENCGAFCNSGSDLCRFDVVSLAAPVFVHFSGFDWHCSVSSSDEHSTASASRIIAFYLGLASHTGLHQFLNLCSHLCWLSVLWCACVLAVVVFGVER